MTDAPRIEGYTDLRMLGAGGFSTVYTAHQEAFSRQVALKVLNAVETDVATIRRFTRECQAAGALSWHPNIVVVFDQGLTADGRPFLAMEHLPGGSLADALEDGPLPWTDAVALCIQVADALAAAHQAGLLHRDVKPANVLRDRFGDAKLADFGIAAVQGAKETATGVVTASIAHAPPEILAGERASTATDVYSLGSTLFALLRGSPAYAPRGQTVAQIIGRVLHEPVPDLRGDGAPAEVATAVQTAMAKEPGDRFATAAAFGQALQAAQVASGVDVTAMRAMGTAPHPAAARDDHTRVVAPIVPPDPATAPSVPANPVAAAPPDPGPPAPPDPAPTPSAPTPAPPAAPVDDPPVPGPGPVGRGRGPLVAVIALVVAALVAGGIWVATSAGDEATGPPGVGDTTTSTGASTSAPDPGTSSTSGPSSSTSSAVTSTTVTTTAPSTSASTVPRSTPEELAVELASTLATAIAVDDWETAASIDVDKADWTEAQWEIGYAPLVRSEIIPYATARLADGAYRLRLGLVAYEITGGDQITRLFCVTWISDPIAGTVRQTAGANQLPFRTGWISLADADALLAPEC